MINFTPVAANHIKPSCNPQPLSNGVQDSHGKTSDKNALSSKVAKPGDNKGHPTIYYDSYDNAEDDVASDWSSSLALKDELFSLESVITLEEKITAASMQNKVSILISVVCLVDFLQQLIQYKILLMLLYRWFIVARSSYFGVEKL